MTVKKSEVSANLCVESGYWALIECRDYSLPRSVLQLTTSHDLHVWSYRSVHVELHFLACHRHQEPLFVINDRLHILADVRRARFSVLGKLNGTRNHRASATMTLWRLPRDQAESVSRHASTRDHIYIDLTSGEILIFSSRRSCKVYANHEPEPTARDVKYDSRGETIEDFSLGADDTDRQRVSAPYELYSAYEREIRRSQGARLLERINALLEVIEISSTHVLETDDFREWRCHLKNLAEEARCLLEGRDSMMLGIVRTTSSQYDELRSFEIDRVANWIKNLHGDLDCFQSGLIQQHFSRLEHLLTGAIQLGVAQRVTDHLCSLTPLSKTSHPIVYFGAEIQLRTFGLADRMRQAIAASLANSSLMPPSEATAIEYPAHFDARIGALPLLARPAGQSIFEDNISDMPGAAKYEFFELKRFVSQFMPTTMEGRDCKTLFAVNSPRDVYFLAPPFRRSIRFLVYDVIATLLMGPAYLYALSRFSIGRGYDLFDARQTPTRYEEMAYMAPLRQRVRICLRCLEIMGVPSGIDFSHYGIKPISGIVAVDEAILSSPFKIYSNADHARACGPVKEALANRDIVFESPRLILNALWDAVVKRERYVDEVATFLSLAEFPSGRMWVKPR